MMKAAIFLIFCCTIQSKTLSLPKSFSFFIVNFSLITEMKIAPSELIINADGSAFHLHVKPEQLADKVILVGDPGRVNNVAKYFDKVESEVESREFRNVTGWYKGKRISVQSTGIGCDNIDIVVTELDALKNIDFNTREIKEKLTQMTLVRIGTCGGLQPFTPIGTFVASQKSIGFDGLLNFYADRNKVCDLDCERQFMQHMDWSPLKGHPYIIDNNPELLEQIARDDMVRGMTIACGGFYGPQGRQLRLRIQDPQQNEKVEAFEYPNEKGNPASNTLKICNFEMESSALAGMSAMLGHKALTVCMVIANRWAQEMNTEYKNTIDDLIVKVLDRI